MRHLLIPLLVLISLQKVVLGSHLNNQREITVTSESTSESIKLAKYLKDNGVVKYSAYWCPNCLNQSELFGKQACLLYTSPSPRDNTLSRMPSSA